ncbi:MAG: hypothetical protein R2753_08700 [Chitinophagales bacterium]
MFSSKYSTYLVVLLLNLSIVSCKQKSSESDGNKVALVDTSIYKNESLGWQITIPDSFNIISEDKMNEFDQQGRDIVGLSEEEVEAYNNGLQHLVSFGKDDFNIFAATAEPFELMYEGEYEDNNRLLNELIYQTFVNQGLSIDTSSSNVVIDELEFMSFKTNIYDPAGELIITQELFNRYINGYDFSVNINYNNDEDKSAMLNAWKTSTFKN